MVEMREKILPNLPHLPHLSHLPYLHSSQKRPTWLANPGIFLCCEFIGKEDGQKSQEREMGNGKWEMESKDSPFPRITLQTEIWDTTL